MNLYLKNISLLFCIILVVAMSDCKKDKVQTQNQISNHDFRDSLVGTYNCVEDSFSNYLAFDSSGSHPVSTNTIIGPAIVTITKLTTDDSSLIVNGNIYSISSSSGQTLYYTSPSTSVIMLPYNELSCNMSNGSLQLTIWIDYWPSGNKYDIYTGRKQ